MRCIARKGSAVDKEDSAKTSLSPLPVPPSRSPSSVRVARRKDKELVSQGTSGAILPGHLWCSGCTSQVLLYESAGFPFTVPQFPLLGTWGFKHSLRRLQGLNPKGWQRHSSPMLSKGERGCWRLILPLPALHLYKL